MSDTPRCPITYDIVERTGEYSSVGLRSLSNKLNILKPLPLTTAEQLREAAAMAGKMSIQGVQPKMSAILDEKNNVFRIAAAGGTYIIKPQNNMYKNLPENEDLTMKMAKAAGIKIPIHGMIYGKDNELSYFIKRYDRIGKRGKKIAVEDFAQLAGRSRETKYNYSMEKVAGIIESFCTFPMLEKSRLFRRVIFCFLTGNEDMHLKNFTLQTDRGKTEFAPAYDLLNTTIALKHPEEEIALPVKGKKRNLTRKILVNYFASERLGLSDRTIIKTLQEINEAIPLWYDLIEKSFLPDDLKDAYSDVLDERLKRIRLSDYLWASGQNKVKRSSLDV